MRNDRRLRLLVTGRNGQVVRALTVLSGAPGEGAPEVLTLARPEFDLASAGTDIAAQVAGFRPDVIVNAAAYTAVDRAESEPDLAFRLNRDGAAAVAEGARACGAALIHISTDYVFDGTKPAPYREDDPVGPMSVYGASKEAGERAVRATIERHVILRAAWIYSPFGEGSFALPLVEKLSMATRGLFPVSWRQMTPVCTAISAS